MFSIPITDIHSNPPYGLVREVFVVEVDNQRFIAAYTLSWSFTGWKNGVSPPAMDNDDLLKGLRYAAVLVSMQTICL